MQYYLNDLFQVPMPNDFQHAVHSIIGWVIVVIILIIILIILSVLWAL